jgi:hypothetical protein
MNTPQRDRILAAALDREPARRAAFLDEACAGDEELRKEVESLLAHRAESLAGGAAAHEATQLLVKQFSERTGERIGRYRGDPQKPQATYVSAHSPICLLLTAYSILLTDS